MARRAKPLIVLGARFLLQVLLAGFFAWSGWQKLQDLSSFTKSVGNFQFDYEIIWNGEARNLFAEPVDAWIAYAVPWFEIVAAIALLIPFTRLAGGLILIGLLGAFNAGLYYAWDLGITDLKCGCHGVSEESTNYPWKIGSNFGLMALIAVIFGLVWWHRRLVRNREIATLEG